MKNSISGLWLFAMVIVFMMILIAYVAISINYSNAYKLKTAMVTKIEQYDGWNSLSKRELDNMLYSSGYRQTGYCKKPDDGSKYIGVLNGNVTVNPVTMQNYCIYRTKRSERNGAEEKYYYHVTVFFGFNLPVLGDIYTFKISGETAEIYYPTNDVTF
ncbi:MAG: hypothetical protein J1F35_05540 [Erysipelotrichales bacterium]|nr:hypothetical protein [Erysipelotrichales bacterium]